MSLPTPAELLTLKYGFNGAPAVILQLSSADTKTLAYAWQGKPLVAVSSSPAPPLGRQPVVFVTT